LVVQAPQRHTAWRVNSRQRKVPKPPCGGSPNPRRVRQRHLSWGGGEAAEAALAAFRCRGFSRQVSESTVPNLSRQRGVDRADQYLIVDQPAHGVHIIGKRSILDKWRGVRTDDAVCGARARAGVRDAT
jgi:hypothetical protein